MTTTGRQVILIIGLLCGFLLIAMGLFIESENSTIAITTGSSMVGIVLGYAAGDRNGEKRLASEILAGTNTARDVAVPSRLGSLDDL